MSRKPRTYTTKPMVVLDDGREGYLLTKGEEQSLLYIIEDDLEQIYPNRWFKPLQPKMRLRMKHRRKRRPETGGAGQ